MRSEVPFDSVARDYDATFTDTAVGRLLRKRVWVLTGSTAFTPSRSRAFTPETAINGLDRDGVNAVLPAAMELNCGTGEDAVWLAQQGWQVLATDISPEMVAMTEEKARRTGVGERIRTQVCSFAEVKKLEGAFDLVFSNFGGLNCASPEELRDLSIDLQRLITPGGRFIAVVMSRFCWWETLYYLLKMKPREALRRWSREPVQARLDEKTIVQTWYYSPTEFRRFFTGFQVKRVSPVGFWLPPSYLNPFFEKRPRLLRVLNFLEKKFAPTWFAPASDHFLICLEKT